MFRICTFAIAVLAAGAFAGQSRAGFLGTNFLVAGEPNTVSDVSQANVAPGSLHTGDVVFGYQQLGQVINTTNGTQNLPTGAAWVVFSFTVDTITPGTGAATGLTFVHFKPTDASNALSLQQLVPNLYAQTGLGSSAPIIALEVNSVPNGSNKQPLISGSGTMTGAMSNFNTGGFSTEFGFGLVAANGDFLTAYGALALAALPVQEAGGATVLYNNDGYTGFAGLPNINPDNGVPFGLTSQVNVSGQIFQAPGVGGAPDAENGAQATDHATYALEPLAAVPEPSSLILCSLAAPFLIGVIRRNRRAV